MNREYQDDLDYIEDKEEFCNTKELDEEAKIRTVDGTFEDDGYDYSQHFQEKFDRNISINFNKVIDRRRVEISKVVETEDGDLALQIGVPNSMYHDLLERVAKEEGMAVGNPELRSKLAGMTNLGDLSEDEEEILELLENQDFDRHLEEVVKESAGVNVLDSLCQNIANDALTKTRVQWGNAAVLPGQMATICRATPEELEILRQREQEEEDSDEYYEFSSEEHGPGGADHYLDEEYARKMTTFGDDQIGGLGEGEVCGGVNDELLDIDENLLDYVSTQMEYYLTEKVRTDLDDKRYLAPLPLVGGVDSDDGVIEIGKRKVMTKAEFREKWQSRVDNMLERSSSDLEDTRTDVDNRPMVHDCQSILSLNSNLYHHPQKVSVKSTTEMGPVNKSAINDMVKPKKGRLRW